MNPHKILAGKKGGIIRAINDATNNGREVPQALRDELKAVTKEIDNGSSSTLSEKRKQLSASESLEPKHRKKVSKHQLLDVEADSSLGNESGFEDTLEQPDEMEMLLSGGSRGSKRMKTEPLEQLLGFLPQVSRPSYIPSSIAVSQAWDNIETVTTPIMLKTENGGTYEVQAEYDPLSASKSFWDMVGAKLKTFASVLNDEAFGTVLPADIEGLDLANGFFPNLLARSGSLRYNAAANKDNKVEKSQYRIYLDGLERNLQHLKSTAKQDLPNINRTNRVTTTAIGTKLLEGTPRAWVSSTEHHAILAGHELLLAQAAELIRRELVGVGIVVSKASESALVRDAEIRSLAAYTFTSLDKYMPKIGASEPGEVKQPREVEQPGEVEQPQPTEVKPPTVDKSKPPTDDKPKLPALFLRQITDSHACRCPQCDPKYGESLRLEAFSQAKKEAKKEAEKDLELEKAKVLATMTEDWEKGREKVMEDRIRKDILKRLGA